VPAAYLDRLQAALDHELDARDFYRQAAGRTGFRRFSNFARAEQNHADRIRDAIRFLGGTPAPRPQAARPGPAGSSAAPQHGRELESAAISIYEDLIRDCPDPDLKPVLQNIQAANRRHLVASGG
jgi:rubrerythrin